MNPHRIRQIEALQPEGITAEIIHEGTAREVRIEPIPGHLVTVAYYRLMSAKTRAETIANMASLLDRYRHAVTELADFLDIAPPAFFEVGITPGPGKPVPGMSNVFEVAPDMVLGMLPEGTEPPGHIVLRFPTAMTAAVAITALGTENPANRIEMMADLATEYAQVIADMIPDDIKARALAEADLPANDPTLS